MDHKASEAVEGLGKIYVGFETVDQAKSALTAIAGRSFGGRSIIAAYTSEELLL